MWCTRQTRTEGPALGRCEGRVQTVLPPTVLAPLLIVAAVLKPRNTQVIETFEPNPCRARWPANQRHQQHQQHNTPSSRSDHIIFHSCVRCYKLDLVLTGVHRVNVDSLTSFTFSSPFWLLSRVRLYLGDQCGTTDITLCMAQNTLQLMDVPQNSWLEDKAIISVRHFGTSRI